MDNIFKILFPHKIIKIEYISTKEQVITGTINLLLKDESLFRIEGQLE
jgi:hypothetical protein